MVMTVSNDKGAVSYVSASRGSFRLLATLAAILFFSGESSVHAAGDAAAENPNAIVKFRYVYEEDARMDYPVRLLRTALAVSEADFGPYSVQTVEEGFSRRREILEVITGERLNVLWAPALEVLKEETIKVPVPILKGLGGYRVFLIRRDNQEKFDRVENVAHLKLLLAGQGSGWRDVDIFRHNGMRVMTSPEFSSLFKMLSHGRFDYFPRGINEVISDFESFRHRFPNLKIEDRILLSYQKPVFFFVSNTAPAIAARLEAGLKSMQQSGEMEALWRRFHGELFSTLKVDERLVIRIDNPYDDIDLRKVEIVE